MKKYFAFVLMLAPLPVTASQIHTDAAVIKAAVKACVPVAQQVQPGFDAFYNPGTTLVENDIPSTILNYEVPLWDRALYNFNKCMSDRGVPLDYAHK